MGMYEDRGPVGPAGSRQLEQGDVLAGVLLAKLPHDRALGFWFAAFVALIGVLGVTMSVLAVARILVRG